MKGGNDQKNLANVIYEWSPKGRWVAAPPHRSTLSHTLFRHSPQLSPVFGGGRVAVIRERAIADQAENIPRIQVKGE